MLKSFAFISILLGTTGIPHSAPLAGLENIYAVLDDATAKAIASSTYLRQFGGLEITEQRSSEGHYRGMYIHGRQTTLELFSPTELNLDHPQDVSGGVVGLEFSSDHIGNLERIKSTLRTIDMTFEERTTHVYLGGHDVEWFSYIERAGAEPDGSTAPRGFGVAMCEFKPSYFDVPEAHKPAALDANDTVSRARYQRNWYDPALLLQDLDGATLAITREDWRRNRKLLAADGYRVKENALGAWAVADVVLDFIFIPNAAEGGIRTVSFKLNRSPNSRHEEQIGNSLLVVGPDAHATWTFRQQLRP